MLDLTPGLRRVQGQQPGHLVLDRAPGHVGDPGMGRQAHRLPPGGGGLPGRPGREALDVSQAGAVPPSAVRAGFPEGHQGPQGQQGLQGRL